MKSTTFKPNFEKLKLKHSTHMKPLLVFLALTIGCISCKTPLEGSITFLTEKNKVISSEQHVLEFIIEEDYWDISSIRYDNIYLNIRECYRDEIPSDLNITYIDLYKEDCRFVSKIESSYFIITRIDKHNIKVEISENLSNEERKLEISLINRDVSETITINQHSNL